MNTPMPRYRLRTLLIALAFAAALAAFGLLEYDEGIPTAIKALIGLSPAAEQHNQEVRELTAP